MPFLIPDVERIDRELCQSLDDADPLRDYRDAFALPENVIYLDGNSLGALPRRAAAHINHVVDQQWGRGLIRSWNAADWINAPHRLGKKIAPLIGAQEDEVIVADSTSVNLYKLLVAAKTLRPDRSKMLSESGNFPTDLYVAQGVQNLLSEWRLKLVNEQEIHDALNGDVAVLFLTHVDFRSGRAYDMAELTAVAHKHGALVVWDLSHSTAAMPIDLGSCNADFAVGCGYKYLNGGPGAPAYLFVARRHQEALQQPITGWMGHASPFDFDPEYVPSGGIARMLSGTPPILALAALEASLDIWASVDLQLVREKSVAMSELLIRLVERDCADSDLRLGSPRHADHRGSHISYHHNQGYAVMRAMIDRGVIGDFREPDLMRFGLAPLYLRFVDVWDAVALLADIFRTAAWDRPEYKRRATVT